jgi:hypothetical protein
MRKTPPGAEGVAPAPLTWGRKKRDETVEKTMSAEKPCRLGTLTRPANPGIFDVSQAMGKKMGVLPSMLKSYALWVYFQMYSPENTTYLPKACCNPALEEAVAAVNRYADLGYVQIKLYSSLKPEFVRGIVEAAHKRGLRVSGHVPKGMVASQMVEDGADELQPINFIFLNFLAGQVKDTRTPERFTAVGENAAKIDLNSKPISDFIQLLQQHGTTVECACAQPPARPDSA